MRALRPSNVNHLHMITLITCGEGHKSVWAVPIVLGPLFPNLIWLRGSFRLEKYRQQPQGLETKLPTTETHETYFYIDKLPQIMLNFTYNFYYSRLVPSFPIRTLCIHLSGIS
jgi:hypothetical protein